MTAAPDRTAPERELRLALVCYGGISLAVYMHGITKEVWRLTRASRARHDGQPPADPGEAGYHALLAAIEQAGKLRLRVLTDIIAGASAGGINSVFLAQAIATGQSLEPLTDLWLEVADVEALLDPDARPRSRLTKFWATPLAWLAQRHSRVVEETVEVAAQAEVRHKLEQFVRSRWFEPPFGGQRLTATMLDALATMAAGPTGPRLLPPGQPLDLFVTVTDFRGHPELLRLNSPPEVSETEHRLVLSFTDRGGTPCEEHAFAHPAELVFAARASSSFPGAFPPFMVGELDAVLAQRGLDWPGRAAFLQRALPRQWAAHAIDSTVLIDGSVLANAPFHPAIEALRERPSRRQIDRRFVFIEPVPHSGQGIGPTAPPGFFATLIGALSDLPRTQPIRDNLDAIAARSDRIETMLAIIDHIRAEVETQVEALFRHSLWLDRPTPKRLAVWRQRAQIAAVTKAGYSHTSYGLLKVESIVWRLARLLCPDPQRRRSVRAALDRLVRERGCNDFGTTVAGGASPATLAFLHDFDLGFRLRRLRLLARRMAELETSANRADFAPIREAIYASLATFLECERSDPYRDLHIELSAISRDAGPVLDRVAAIMALRRLDAETDRRLSDALNRLPPDPRRAMLLAHLGFPFFDIATLPLLQGEGSDEFDPIRVDRISPDDATAIRSGGAAATLKGIQFNGFGAFFSRAWRENDYLWGRLHGADRLIDIVLSTLPGGVHLPPGEATRLKQQLFRAILDEEEARLTHIPGLFRELWAEIG